MVHVGPIPHAPLKTANAGATLDALVMFNCLLGMVMLGHARPQMRPFFETHLPLIGTKKERSAVILNSEGCSDWPHAKNAIS